MTGGHTLTQRATGGPWNRLGYGNNAIEVSYVDVRRIYDCRHTFASWAIAGGVQLFYLARIMGTSVAQIDATYGHLLPDSEDYLRGLLDAYDDVRGLTVDQAGR